METLKLKEAIFRSGQCLAISDIAADNRRTPDLAKATLPQAMHNSARGSAYFAADRKHDH